MARDNAINWVYVQVDLIKVETDKAFLCLIGDEEMWLPKSQIEDVDDYAEGDTDVELAISEWIANEKGLA